MAYVNYSLESVQAGLFVWQHFVNSSINLMCVFERRKQAFPEIFLNMHFQPL